MTDYKSLLDDGIFEINSGKFESGIKKINLSLELKKDWEIPYFYRAVAYHALGRYDEAMLDYTKALLLNDKMTDAYYNRAKIILTQKNADKSEIEKAVLDLEKALDADEKFLEALYAMAAAQKKLGNYEKALEYLEKLLVIEPEAVNASALKKLLMQKYL